MQIIFVTIYLFIFVAKLPIDFRQYRESGLAK